MTFFVVVVRSVQEDYRLIANSTYCLFLRKISRNCPQGAPEGVIERCTHVRVGNGKVPLSQAIKDKVLSTIRDYGTGRDTLRCLALATRDNPPAVEDMNLIETAKFSEYEVKDPLCMLDLCVVFCFCFVPFIPVCVDELMSVCCSHIQYRHATLHPKSSQAPISNCLKGLHRLLFMISPLAPQRPRNICMPLLWKQILSHTPSTVPHRILFLKRYVWWSMERDKSP